MLCKNSSQELMLWRTELSINRDVLMMRGLDPCFCSGCLSDDQTSQDNHLHRCQGVYHSLRAEADCGGHPKASARGSEAL